MLCVVYAAAFTAVKGRTRGGWVLSYYRVWAMPFFLEGHTAAAMLYDIIRNIVVLVFVSLSLESRLETGRRGRDVGDGVGLKLTLKPCRGHDLVLYSCHTAAAHEFIPLGVVCTSASTVVAAVILLNNVKDCCYSTMYASVLSSQSLSVPFTIVIVRMHMHITAVYEYQLPTTHIPGSTAYVALLYRINTARVRISVSAIYIRATTSSMILILLLILLIILPSMLSVRVL